MKWTMSVHPPSDDAYWHALYAPQSDMEAYDYTDPPYVVILVDNVPYVSPNEYRLASDQDIGPFESVETAITAAEMLNAQEGWTG